MTTRKSSFKIVLKNCDLPLNFDLSNELRFLCESFGFFEDIDRGKTAFAVFKSLISGANSGKKMTSTWLAHEVKMSRGSVINHLNNLLRAGLIVKEGRYYFPRSKSTYLTIKELEYDIEQLFKKLELISKRIDKRFGFEIEDL